MLKKQDLKDFLFEELEVWLSEARVEPYRARQIWEWMYHHFASSFEDMTNVPKGLVHNLQDMFYLSHMAAIHELSSSDETRKYVFELADGYTIESVLLPHGRWITACLSTQVGCRFACRFCQSGVGGLKRSLRTGEIVDQFIQMSVLSQRRVNHIVFMGIGEPFDNYENCLRAVRIFNDPRGLKIGARRMTLSTCGLVPGIRRLAKEGIQVELSVSLHAATDDVRSTLVPINRKYPLEVLMEACEEYTSLTKRIVTFEYTPIRGVNDSDEHIQQLIDLLSRFTCRVNIVPLSPSPAQDSRPSTPDHCQKIVRLLMTNGVHATIRKSRGQRIKAACGQLAAGV